MPGAAYFITTCLEGSISARGQLEIARRKEELRQQQRPEDVAPADWAASRWKKGFARMEGWLDAMPAVTHLADERLARQVMSSLYYFAGRRHDLLAFVVMPSHIHWVFQPLESWLDARRDRRSPREEILHSINGFTGRECNRILRRSGAFWQHESYDHWIRDAGELERIIRYVENNPVKAELCANCEDWPFSSAHDRRRLGLEFGEPLLAPARVEGTPAPG
jgi:type I restriction enzyme R subunit